MRTKRYIPNRTAATSPILTIGILCEGAQTDAPVLEVLLKHKFPSNRVRFIIKGVSKADIFGDPGPWINLLVHEGAERIIVVWDITPTGYGMAIAAQWSQRPNRSEQRRMLLERMAASTTMPEKLRSQVNCLASRYEFILDDPPAVTQEELLLICVCYTVEGWLLSDHNILCALASTRERKVAHLNPSPDKPDRCREPSITLARCFREVPNKRFRYYNKHEHNPVIAQSYVHAEKVDSMRASQSFVRLVDTITKWIS